MGEGDEREAALFDISGVASMSDGELSARHGELARIERREFHENLTTFSFIGAASHLINPPLDDARRAVEREMQRRGIRPPDNP